MRRQSKSHGCIKPDKYEILNDLLMKSIMSGKIADVRKWIEQGANVNYKRLKGEFHCQKCHQNNQWTVERTPIAAALMGKNDAKEKDAKSPDEFFEIFKLLIENGADVNQTIWMEEKESFCPVIFMAIAYGFVDFVEYLIQKGADLTYRCRNNLNCLFVAVSANNLEVAKLLLKHKSIKRKIDVKLKNYGHTALHVAIHLDHADMARLLLLNGASYVNSRMGTNGYSILHTASFWGHIDIIEDLLKKGADTEAKDHKGVTPLMVAVMFRKVEVIKCLLEYGANPNGKAGTDKMTCLYRVLDKKTDNITEFIIFKLLLKYGARTDEACGTKNWTPLHVAASFNRSYQVKFLLDLGTNVDIEASHGVTPLHLATDRCHEDVVKILIKAGANINKRGSKDQWTPLHTAVNSKSLKMVQLLVENGADIDPQDSQGTTPLLKAFLIMALQELEGTDKKGENDMAPIIHYLLDNGAKSFGETDELLEKFNKNMTVS